MSHSTPSRDYFDAIRQGAGKDDPRLRTGLDRAPDPDHRAALEAETRAAIARWVDAAEYERRTVKLDAYEDDALRDLVSNRRTEAERQAIAMIYAWDAAFCRFDVIDAWRTHLPPRGVVFDGFLYVTAPHDDDQTLLMETGAVEIGSREREGRFTLQLCRVPLAGIVNLDAAKGGL